MKEKCLNLVLALVHLEARVLRRVGVAGKGARGRVAVLEPCPTSSGSNGDEALVAGTCRFLAENPGRSVEVLSFYDGFEGQVPAGAVYGGSLYRRSDGIVRKLYRYFTWPLLVGRYDAIYVIGADLVDSYYSASISIFLFWLLRLATILGVEGHLISFSFNASPGGSVSASMRRNLPGVRLHARDAISAGRLSAMLGREVTHSADVAFGLKPAKNDRTALLTRWADRARDLGRKPIALNINMLPVSKQFPGKEGLFVAQWARWVTRLAADGFSIVLLPHDYRGEWGDQVAARRVFSTLDGDTQAHVLEPAGRLSAAETKDILSAVDFAVTGRMHLAIASMGVGTPVVGYAYQGKFEGIFALSRSGEVHSPAQESLRRHRGRDGVRGMDGTERGSPEARDR